MNVFLAEFLSDNQNKMDSEAFGRTVMGVVLCTIIFTQGVKGQGTWQYSGVYGVDHWWYLFDTCDAYNHTRQSPINIVVNNTQYDSTLTPISLVITKASDNDTMTMINTGYTVNFNYDKSMARISGGHLNNSFRVGYIHFHWGSNNTEGCEHTIDSQRYPAEMHIVSYDDTRFSSVPNATGAVNSIAVLGVLFTLSTSDNPILDPILSGYNNVTYAGNTTKIPYFDISTLLPQDTTKYYRYLGSLTTPPCAESVVWTIFQTMQTISIGQLNAFRRLVRQIESNGTIDYLEDNWRPQEPIGARIVSRSYQNLNSSPSGPGNAAYHVAPLTAVTMMMMIVAVAFMLA